LNQVKKIDQNFLPEPEEALLDQIHAIVVGYRTGSSIDKGKFATDAGLLKNSLLAVEDKVYTEKGKRSTIDLLTLVKILIKYPALKRRLGEYLCRNTEENLTGGDKTIDNNEFMDNDIGAFYRRLIEENTEYRLMPKKILDDYDIVPKKESDSRSKVIDIITAAKDDVIRQQSKLIVGYEEDISTLQKERDELKALLTSKNSQK
jgi:hypothetical protein